MSSSDPLQTPLVLVKGVGPRRAATLASAGLTVLEDLLLRLPIRYEDRSKLRPIAALRAGDTAAVRGEVLRAKVRSTRRRGFSIVDLLVGDRSGQIRVVFFNQPFLGTALTPPQSVFLFGTVEEKTGGGLQLTNPQHERVVEGADACSSVGIHIGRIVPVYERVGSVTPKMMRRIVFEALGHLSSGVDDALPESVRRARGWPGPLEAFWQSHFPADGVSIDELNRFRTSAQVRVIFEEFFFWQVGLALRRRVLDERSKPHVVVVDDRIRRAAARVLPFRLTAGQRQALKEIVDDLRAPRPMNRLLQGDVGSGKTIVAALAALVALENGLQVAFMAPTELLADQHYRTLSRVLGSTRFSPARLTGALGSRARRDVSEALATGRSRLVVGTQALVQEVVGFQALGLVIIDEQHRFGVGQRAALRAKGVAPDVLVMTATPIPRTLQLTAYGDLSATVIRDRPPGRQPVVTRVVSESERGGVYAAVAQELARARQAFVVFPLVEETEARDLRAATETARDLARMVFRGFRVGLVHGRMKTNERERVMDDFAAGQVDVLAATTVVEVGVDVARATVMVIEHAERFGLAQLHQLRGRVGRGSERAWCALLYREPLTAVARARLDAIAETTDGFVLAERDLELRGPGDVLGTRQSGLPELRVGQLVRDHDVMEDARNAARVWLDEGNVPDDVVRRVRAHWSRRDGLVGVG